MVNIREFLNFDNIQIKKNEIKVDALFSKILKRAKEITIENGGEFYFVYLPIYERYSTSEINHDEFLKRKEVLDSVKLLDIKIIDVHKDIFSKYEDPLLLYPLSLPGHYTEEGYLKVAKLIIETVNE